MKLKDILPSQVNELLTEESLTTIQTAIDNRIQLSTEAALIEQDNLFADKLNTLLESIELDYAKKFKRALDVKDKEASRKLLNIVHKYDNEINESAAQFKSGLVTQLSDFLEIAIDDAIPREAIAEATKNRVATDVLTNLRQVLAVDSALMSESVKGAVVDGKARIEELEKQVQGLSSRNKIISENYNTAQANLILEQKSKGFPLDKKNYLVTALSDKTPEFIAENFDYTASLYDRKERRDMKVLKEEAFNKRVVREDAPAPADTINEQASKPSVAPDTAAYLAELDRAK